MLGSVDPEPSHINICGVLQVFCHFAVQADLLQGQIKEINKVEQLSKLMLGYVGSHFVPFMFRKQNDKEMLPQGSATHKRSNYYFQQVTEQNVTISP